jgi:hypothetical protein
VTDAKTKISTSVKRNRHTKVDALEKSMLEHEQVFCPIDHVFTPHLYTRICHIPKGTLLTSEIHLTEHPFFIMQGKIKVADIESGETLIYEAPFIGVTKPNTRRVLEALEYTIWATCHATEETDVEKIGEAILAKRDLVPQYKIENNFKLKIT